MKPVDYRNETFASLKTRLLELRLEVYDALKVHGPCTTEQLAAAMRPSDPLFVLTVRPRVTELCQLGFAVLVEGEAKPCNACKNGATLGLGWKCDVCGRCNHSRIVTRSSSGGTYRAASEFEARQLFDAAKREAMREQTLLNL
ncbi:MAG: hypothetical protein NTY01_08780 [Verrucomicrobia bacterium]|nr:hypothetical protein [Verrucomicrobiota bacterium]